MKRLRVTRIAVQVEAFVDDGETLTPLDLTPTAVAYADWPKFDLEDALSEVRAQVEATIEPPPNRATRRANGKKKAPA